jgi:hypothetical protein
MYSRDGGEETAASVTMRMRGNRLVMFMKDTSIK